MDTEDLISITKAAQDLGVSRGSIYDAIAGGRLHAVTIGGKQFLKESDVRAYVPRAYEGKRENKRQPGVKGPSCWNRSAGIEQQAA